ncbi:hypothetical protein NLJ89_g3567 [Agrocybe chaxingu]|uniref:NACHT domain-containing protein n=1 Tax=Agrocybe chaxingu TaxID=84603 RepID=A0A9W8K507_9AGAR|nr:hypothetical protein NLJ89_g3567 [Agrocybe chaxingu]
MGNGGNVAIFWDYENCPAPSNGSGYLIAKNISTLAQQFGTVKSFKAYLEISEQPPRALVMRSELQSSGVSLIDCPHNGRKDVADKMMLVDMLAHAIDNPPPSTAIILITGDRDFAYALSILRLRRYHVVLLTLANAHPSLTMQASVCYDWVSEVIDVVNSPKSQSGITGRAGQGVNDPRNESPADSASSGVGSTVRRTPQLEDGIRIEEPIDFTNYLSGYTRLRQPLQSSNTYNPQLVSLERSREDTSTANHVRSQPVSSPPATIRNASALLPFPSTLCTPQQSMSRFPLIASAPKCSSAPPAAVNTTTTWTPSQDISVPAQPNVQSTLALADRDRTPVLLDTDIVVEGISAPRPPPASAPSLLPSPPPFLPQSPQPALKPPSIAPPLPSPKPPQSPQPCTSSATFNVAATIRTTPQTAMITANTPMLSTGPLKPTTVALAIEEPGTVPQIFAILVDALQNHRLKGILRPLRSTIAVEISKNGATYRNAGVVKFSQYVALAQQRGIIDLGGSDGADWISLRPGCHPKTRQAVRKKILEWLKDPSSPLLMWLYGPAGAGKSAIAQMIVEICLEEGWLSASFFFSRRAKAESDKTKLIATLAYQLLKYIPATRPFIEAAVTNDPSIFDLTIWKQIQALILGPLSQVSSSLSEPTSPKLIIIDGLDECSNQEAQGQIVQQFADAVQHMQRKIPHKVIIASRPEQWLASAFCDEQVIPHLERLCLDDTWCPDKDIEVFLANSFADIRRKHPLAAHIAPDWPSKFVISELVFKSSGQFIFASVVVKYVNSPRHNPVDRLEVVRGLKKDERNPPFAVLDALYRQILMSVEEQSLLLPVLRIAFMPLIPPLVDLTMALKTIQCLLRLSNGVVELLLNDLLSILAVHTSGKLSEITFHHVSFQDFLFDRDRSKEFFIGNGTVRDDLAQDCLRFISNYKIFVMPCSIYVCSNISTLDPDMDFDDCWEICLHGPVHLLYGIPLERMAAGVRTALDNLDMHAILRSASITKTRQDFVDVPAAIVQLVQFLMPMDASSPLPQAVGKLKDWILTHLHGFPFNGFDNAVCIDLTVFALPYNELDHYSVPKYISRITRILARALSLSVIPKPVFTKELMLCWDLIARFSAIFTSSDLCGDYAITEARQTNAACLCTQYVIDPMRVLFIDLRNAILIRNDL